MRRHKAQSLARIVWFLATLVLAAWAVEWMVWLGGKDVAWVTRFGVPWAFLALVLTWFLQRRFHRPKRPENRDLKIAVVGAGPAGLAAAYFLKLRGYREVLVLEKQGRVGGLCRTVTEDYLSFDLGANYVTPAYRETLALADEVGAELYVERPITTVNLNGDSAQRPTFSDPWTTVRGNTSVWRYIKLCIRYVLIRRKLGRIIDPPGHKRIDEHPELCISFWEWLTRHDLQPLRTLFEAPITVMGYGDLEEIPTPYALKYMSVPTFVALGLKAFPLTASWFPWPRRFVLGFQRLWEAVSWELNVRLNVEIKDATRVGDKIQIKLTHMEQVLHRIEPHEDVFEFDRLILACPLTKEALGPIWNVLSNKVKGLLGQIQSQSYCLTSFTVENLQLNEPIAAALPLPPIGVPFAITKQMPESQLVQFYSRVPDHLDEMLANAGPPPALTEDQKQHLSDAARKEHEDPVRGYIVGKVREVVKQLGGSVVDDRWHTFDRWPYFQHVSGESMAGGFYQELEAFQGQNHVFYTGSVMNFELVETSIAYSKQLVERFFVGVHSL